MIYCKIDTRKICNKYFSFRLLSTYRSAALMMRSAVSLPKNTQTTLTLQTKVTQTPTRSINLAHPIPAVIYSPRPTIHHSVLPKHLYALLQRLESLRPTTRSSIRRAEDELRLHLPARIDAPLFQGCGAEVGLIVLQAAAETFDRKGGPDWMMSEMCTKVSGSKKERRGKKGKTYR